MTSISDAKVLGGIGSLLVLFSVVPNIGWLLGIAGFIMVLLAVKNISQVFSEPKIYRNMQNAVVLAIGAIVVGTITVVGTIYHLFSMGAFVGSRFVLPHSLTTSGLVGLAAIVVLGAIAVEALLVFSAVFVRRSFTSIASKLNIHSFETAGLLFLIGAATAFVGVGLVLIVISEILLAVSFFSIREPSEVPAANQPQAVAANSH